MEVTRNDIERELRSRFQLYTAYDKQKAFHNSTAVGKIISGGNQLIPLYFFILTPNGWRKSVELKIGDLVYNRSGKAVPIEWITEVKEAPLYEIEFNDGTRAECSDDHLWQLVTKRGNYVTHDTKWMIEHWRPSYFHIPINEPIEFEEKPLVVPPYLFGLYLGNGWIHDTRIYMSDSYETYTQLCEIFSLTAFTKSSQTFSVKGSNIYLDYLRPLGHAKDKYIPEEYLRSSIEQRKELLAGLIDSDGSIDEIGRVAYHTTSKRLADNVCDLMRGLGCKVRLTQRLKHTEINGHEYDCMTYQVRGRCPFKPNRIKHKHEWIRKMNPDYRTKSIIRIRYLREEKQRCYRVSGEDHTFILEGYNVTHNCGKSHCGTHEVAFQATGIWPEWHTGWHLKPRLDTISGKMVCSIVVAATDSKTLRDNIMKKIIGTEMNDYSDGLIARKFMVEGSFIKSRGVSGGLLDSVQVKRQDGSICTLYFRSYEQGRENLQSLTADLVYCDEEPPQDVYSEMMARLAATGGHFMMAFTPLKGMTPIVQEYWNGDDPEKELFCMSIYEVDHIAKFPEKIAQIKSMYAGLSEAEREARMMGIPAMGSGVVYPIDDVVLKCDAFPIPNDWKRICGLDFGRGEHPIAAVWLAFDPEGVCYLYDCFKLTRVGDLEVANQLLSRGDYIPVSWPHDFVRSSGISSINGLEKTEGWKYKEIYEKYGIQFTDTNAKTAEGSTRVEAGIVEVRQAMIEGKFRVFSHLSEWFKEKATYLYKEDGTVTKEKDDLLDATRYAYIMRRYAVSKTEHEIYNNGYINLDRATDNTLDKDYD